MCKMCKGKNNALVEKSGSSLNIDVTKIVKYVCIAGVMIVAIIFGTRCYLKMINKDKELD
ncbi:hypothetical protein [Anaerocolumna sp.]|uniref:hypothetical protein n=1 Tax=Anaerocolumna sp. TaxID=2041569 RepID=UPI0028A73EF3|nr:hypothetical protein [Anaerocolumna sp.]